MEILPPETIQPLSAYQQLSPAKRRFVDECMINGVPWKAYQTLYPQVADATARSQANHWCKDGLVRAALAERMGEVMRQNEITAGRVISEIGKIAFSNLRRFIEIDEAGNPSWNFGDVSDADWSTVKSFTTDETIDEDGKVKRKTKIELHDKNAALDKLMKRFGLYQPEVIEHRHTLAGDQPIRVNASPAEAAERYAKLLTGN